MRETLFFFLSILTSIALFSPDLHSKSQAYEMIEDQATLPILSPTFNERKTAKLQLTNGLSAYIVSDPKIQKASVALVVKSGSWEDPTGHPGMAHFLEHMLFLGTKKYPGESDFESFISEHGGETNAFTGIDSTSYAFSIDPSALKDAIDRFVQFFIDPLLTLSGTARELEAIDQEYANNIQNDDIREYYVLKEISNQNHPNHAFSMGNKNSLGHLSHGALKAWYESYYSANRMRLIVRSNASLDDLKTLVVQHFKAIPNRNTPPFNLNLEIIPPEIKAHMVTIEPVKNMRRLSILWEMPKAFASTQKSKPELIICQILDDAGKGSLLNELKREQLADNVSCSGSKLGPNNFEFSLEISLTDKGVKQINKVIYRCFQAIAKLKKEGVPKAIFDEVKLASTLSYQYQEKEDSFEDILKEAGWIAKEDIATYPEQTRLIQTFDPEAINAFTAHLTPKNAVFVLMAPSSLTEATLDKNEKWLDVSYHVLAIPKETLSEWETVPLNPNMTLPAPNPFLPENLIPAPPRRENAAISSYPAIASPLPLVKDDFATIYFANDNLTLVPKICWTFEIKTPAINVSTLQSVVCADLLVKIISDNLANVSYPAKLAGLEYTLESSNNGLFISIEGFNEKASILFFEIIQALKTPRLREQKFHLFKRSLLRRYQNAALENPLMQALDILKSMTYQEYATNKAKAIAIKKITFDDIELFADSLFKQTYTEGMLYGNMTKAQAKQLSKKFLSLLDSKPYLKQERFLEKVILLPKERGPYFIESNTKANSNVALLSIESEPFSFMRYAAQEVLMQAIKQPFFNDLRTKQQTGYSIISQADELDLHLFNTFIVQSNTHAARDLLSRFELFIENFLQEIETSFPKKRFEIVKKALLTNLKKPPKNISVMGSLLYKLAFKYDENFNWVTDRIKGLQELSYDKFLIYANQVLGKQNKERLAVLLKGTLPKKNSLEYQKITNKEQWLKQAEFQPADFSKMH